MAKWDKKNMTLYVKILAMPHPEKKYNVLCKRCNLEYFLVGKYGACWTKSKWVGAKRKK